MKPKRIAAWWYSLEDLNWPSVDGKEKIEKYAKELYDSDVDTVILYGAHFRFDWLPYFTILHSYIKAIADELHKYGIKLFDHHSVNLVHRYTTVEEMERCMVHSAPHIPFSPSREAAASWEYEGKKLNDWRMIDVKTREPLYYPQYSAEGFCYRNPDFIDAYTSYAKRLVADTGIDGLMADDAVNYMHMNSCACPHCRAELKKRTGHELPDMYDTNFWGNFSNPDFLEWIKLRFEASGNFYEKLRAALPEDFTLTACGNASAPANAIGNGADVRQFLCGCNYANLELCGNTPAYKHDPVTVNATMQKKIVDSSLHYAVAKEKGYRCFGTGYGFTEPSAEIIWATNKFVGADCYMSTLKPRLGLKKAELAKLPNEAQLVKNVFHFEKEHEDLFSLSTAANIGVYYSYNTRNTTFFGATSGGFFRDYSATLLSLLEAGQSAETIVHFPKDNKTIKAVIIPSAVVVTGEEQSDMEAYIKAGGIVYATGYSGLPGVNNTASLPDRPGVKAEDFFSKIRDKVWHKSAAWVTDTTFPELSGDWQTLANGVRFNPHRCGEKAFFDEFLNVLRNDLEKSSVELISQKGYLVNRFGDEAHQVIHFLAADYDTEIDKHLDEIRFHRSRVNLITKVTPIGISRVLVFESRLEPTVYLPITKGEAKIEREGEKITITLPENTSYAIVEFK